MVIKDEPYLIEYNVRMGDPECQTILPRLKTDFLKVINAVVEKKLDKINLEWDEDKALSVVLCSKGYPEKYEKDKEINDLNKMKLNKNEFIFHAGTKFYKSKILSNGGRVLNIVAKSKSFKQSREIVLNLIRKINWKHGFFRKDIGFKVIDK